MTSPSAPLAPGKEELLALLQAQRLAEAKAAGEALCRAQPHDPEVWQLLGVAHGALGESEAAEGCFRRAIQLAPDYLKAHRNLALALIRQHKTQEAIESLQTVTRLDPRDAEAHYSLGNLFYDQGNLDAAATVYREALRLNPDHAQAHNNLGVVRADQGRAEEAIACYRQALQLKPDHVEAYYNLGCAYNAQGESEKAIAAHQSALSLKPDYLEARLNLSLALRALGRREEAVRCLKEVLRIKPDFAQAHYQMGDLLREQEQWPEAEACYEAAIRAKADYPEAWINLGLVLTAQKKYPKAIGCFKEALRLQPDSAESCNNLGIAYAEQDQLDEAIACYQETLRLRPDYAEAHNNLGNVYAELDRLQEAIAYFKEALRLKPDYVGAYNNLGGVYFEQRRLDEAMACYQEALRCRPDSAGAYCSLGCALKAQGMVTEAESYFKRALELDPFLAEAHRNLGYSLAEQSRIEEPLARDNKALQINTEDAETHLNISFVELSLGRFAEGWHHYLYRHFLRSKNPLPPPPSLAADLNGRRLLVMRDQGLGDELFFLRFVPQLKARGAWVAYCPDPRLASILARVKEIDRIVALGEPLEALDYTFSVGDLPLLLGMDDVSKIPAPLPLPVQPEQLAAVKQRLAGLGPPPYVGVTWRAGIKDKRKLYKEAPLAALAEVLEPLTATVLILQRHPQAGEVESFSELLGRPAHDLGAVNENLEDMLALLDLLDDYVGVSNTNMHLRAATGKTARVLVPHPPEWRWMAEREESPWFSGFRVYRQGYDKNWEQAFENLKKDLSKPTEVDYVQSREP